MAHEAYMAMRARTLAVIEGLEATWPADALAEVRFDYDHGELECAISQAYAYAETHGFGSVKAEMLALARDLGVHDRHGNPVGIEPVREG